MKAMTEKMKKKLAKMAKDETVFWGDVTRIGKNDAGPYMEVTIPEVELAGTIVMDEVDAEVERKSLLPLLGHKIPFVVLNVAEDDRIMCSRKQAQMLTKIAMTQDLIDRTVLHGEVVRSAPYGVYIEVNGISGLLKNADYINVAIPVSDYLKEGDEIDVICKTILPSGKIQWEPAVKPEVKPIEYDVEENTCVTGKVINMKPFSTGGVGVFVRIGQGLDALCLLPNDMEVNPDDTVSLKITTVTRSANPSEPPRVRGKLLRVI